MNTVPLADSHFVPHVGLRKTGFRSSLWFQSLIAALCEDEATASASAFSFAAEELDELFKNILQYGVGTFSLLN